MELRSDLIRDTLLGLIILGIGGRLLMRVIAHMEGRVPVFGVSRLLPLPQAIFMTLALIYLVIMDLLGRRLRQAHSSPGDQVQPAF